MNKLFKFLFICKINTLYHQAKSCKKLYFVTLIIYKFSEKLLFIRVFISTNKVFFLRHISKLGLNDVWNCFWQKYIDGYLKRERKMYFQKKGANQEQNYNQIELLHTRDRTHIWAGKWNMHATEIVSQITKNFGFIIIDCNQLTFIH